MKFYRLGLIEITHFCFSLAVKISIGRLNPNIRNIDVGLDINNFSPMLNNVSLGLSLSGIGLKPDV